MAASSNRSPSPTSNRQNPSSRSTDQNPRRSLSGSPFPRLSNLSNSKSFNPITPANSPSGFCSRVCEDKENDKDHALKTTRVRSPGILKMGSKNFMAPTISATSKFTPSPRKKILEERNESVQTSISDSFEKVVERFETNSELGSEENDVQASQDESVITLNLSQKEEEEEDSESLQKETPSDFHLKSDCLKKMPISSAVSPIIEDGPSPPPYDPKTNYLSPRPQFLHFKPNPRRIGSCLKENGEIRKLEDIFELENLSSDSESTEENDSNDLESCEQDPPPEVETKEAEHQEEEEEEEQVEVGVEVEESINDLQVSEPQAFRKRRFFSRFRFISLLMILVVGFLSFSATYSPIFNGSSVLKDPIIPRLYHPSELKDVFEEFVMNFSSAVKDSSIPKHFHPSELKDVFEEFVTNFKDWSSKHIPSYVSKLMPRINGLDKLPATIQFYNLSSFQEYALINSGGFVDHIKLDLEDHNQDFEDEDETEELQEENGNLEIEEEAEEESENDIIESGTTEEESLPLQPELDQNEEQSCVLDANLVIIQEVDSPSIVGDDILTHEGDSSSSVMPDSSFGITKEESLPLQVESDQNEEQEQGSVLDANLLLIQEVGSPSVVGDDDVIVDEVDSSSPLVVDADVQTSKEEELSPTSSTHTLLTEANSTLDHILATIAVLLVILVPAFLYVNRRQKRNEVKKMADEARVLDNDPAPCSSEASSFQTSVASKKKSLKETAASEKRVVKSNSSYSKRRESMASSSTEFSMESPSYGSYTTYEKITMKNNGVDGEIVTTTPVRRSSRIRSQVVVNSSS